MIGTSGCSPVFGVRKLGEAAPVDGRTLFEVAPNSKAFTAAALAMLVDEGRLAWDDPVTQHLPDFQMADPYVTHEMTVRDLLVHRSRGHQHECRGHGALVEAGGRLGADGTGRERRLYSDKQAREMWTAQTPMRIREPDPRLAATRPNFLAYGLGFQLRDYRGHLLATPRK